MNQTCYAFILLLVTTSSLLISCSDKPATKRPPPSVKILEVQAKDAAIIFEFVGRTASSQQVEVRTRVEGFLEERVYNEGSIVQKGDVMFKVDDKPFKTQLAAADAALAQQQAILGTASSNLKRVKPLAEANAVSKKDLDDAQGNVNSATAAVAMAKADVDTAKLNLGYTTIYAPVTGASSFSRIQNGAFVSATNSLLTYVAQLDPMWVDFNISENDMLKARSLTEKGQLKMPEDSKFDVELKLADDSKYPQTGHIFFSDANYSTDTGTFLIRASFDNPKQHLRPGQFVKVLLKGAIQPNAILLPQSTVLQGANGFFVWIIDADNKAQIRNIQVGDWHNDDWFITSGLSAGDRVVTDGLVHLSINSPVKIVTTDDNNKKPGANKPNPVISKTKQQ